MKIKFYVALNIEAKRMPQEMLWSNNLKVSYNNKC